MYIHMYPYMHQRSWEPTNSKLNGGSQLRSFFTESWELNLKTSAGNFLWFIVPYLPWHFLEKHIHDEHLKSIPCGSSDRVIWGTHGYPFHPISLLRWSANGHGTPKSLPSHLHINLRRHFKNTISILRNRGSKIHRNLRSAFITNSGTKKSSEIGSKSSVIMRMSNIWYVLIIYIYI